MEVQITVPKKAKLAVVKKEYPDIYQDGDEEHGDLSYFVETEWMTRDEAIACCGFVEGAIPTAETMLEGNGGWAQGMIRESDIYWKAFQAGVNAAALLSPNA